MENEKIIDIPPIKGYLDYQERKNTSIKAIIIYILIMYAFNTIVQFILLGIAPIITGYDLYELNELGEKVINAQNNIFINSWTQIIVYVALTISLIYISKHYLIEDLKASKNNIRKIIIQILIGFGIFYISSIASSIFLWIFKINDSSANQNALIEIVTGKYGPLVLFTIVLLGPLCEEIIFRQSAFNLFKPGTKPWIKITITGAVFGFIHVATAILSYILMEEHYSVILKEFLLGIPYILQGIALSFIYHRSQNNIVPTAIIHILNNLLAAIVIFIQ